MSSIRVCVIGAGRAGQVHANSLVNHLPGAELVAIVDTRAAQRHEVAARYGVNRTFETLREALEKSAFDAVVITTPTFTHRALVGEAAAAGRHIFCEKPMALSLRDCDEMMAAAERAGVILQLGFMRRFDPAFEAAAARIEAGDIGRPMLIKSLTHGPGLPPAWAHDLSASNGMLAEVNSHDWDTIRWLAFSDPVRVYTEVANFKGAAYGVQAQEFYDCALALVRFESGALASISGVCPCEYGYDARVEIVGEKGLLQIGTLEGQPVIVCTSREQGLISPVFRSWPERFADAYVREMRHFLDCIREARRPRVTGEDGRWAVASVLAATKSFREGRPVEISEILEKAATERRAP